MGAGGAIATSEDGMKWTAAASGTSTRLSVAHDGKRWIAVSPEGRSARSLTGRRFLRFLACASSLAAVLFADLKGSMELLADRDLANHWTAAGCLEIVVNQGHEHCPQSNSSVIHPL